MMRVLGKHSGCQIALAAIAAVALLHSDAMAWSYGSYGSTGSYGSLGSYGSSGSYASYGSSGGSYGSHGGLGSRIRARRAARQAARASYGSYGSYGSSGSYGSTGSYGSYGSSGSYGSTGSYGSSGSYGTVIESTPVEAQHAPEEAAPVEAPAEPEPAAAPADDSAAIEVTLPADAKVFVNGTLTTSTGSSRSYVSKGLQQGRTYSYKLRVEFDRNGEQVVEQKAVRLSSGDKVELNFGSEGQEQVAASEEPVKTAMNVTVPAEARVYLSGIATKQTGADRSFVTQQLASGQLWEGYTIRVELEKDGKQLVQERTLTIQGGESYELAFDFDQQEALQVAQLD